MQRQRAATGRDTMCSRALSGRGRIGAVTENNYADRGGGISGSREPSCREKRSVEMRCPTSNDAIRNGAGSVKTSVPLGGEMRSSGVPQDPVRHGPDSPRLCPASCADSWRARPRWQGGILSTSATRASSARRHVGQAHSWAPPVLGHWQRRAPRCSPLAWKSERRRGAPESASARTAAASRLKRNVRTLPNVQRG
jgi:hypothetical protein